MATTNGEASPPATSDSTAPAHTGKRKRADTMVNGDPHVNGHEPSVKSELDGDRLQAFLKDIVEILKGYDTTPSILQQPIDLSPDSKIDEPAAKRKKTSPPTAQANIISRLDSCAYSSLNSFLSDIDKAMNNVQSLTLPKDQSQAQLVPAAPEERALVEGILAFRKILNGFVIQEEMQKPAIKLEDADLEDDDKIVINGVSRTTGPTPPPSSVAPPTPVERTETRSVLTLLGGNPPRQLFSSLQKSVEAQGSIEVTPPLRDAPLPNGIHVTKIVPTIAADDKPPKVATLGEFFTPTYRLDPIPPPKQSKQTMTRSSTVDWVQPGKAEIKRTKMGTNTYPTEEVLAGQWLNYTSAPPVHPPQSPEAKRRQRDRALSTGDAKPTLNAAEIEAERIREEERKEAKKESLFRSVYSSFAPTHDDTSAVIPSEVRNRIWWEKVGANRFQTLFAGEFEAALTADLDEESRDPEAEEDDEDKMFREAVESWQPDESPSDLLNGDKAKADQDQDLSQILEDVSDLLQTLSAFQKIRMSSLGTNSKPAIAHSSQDSALMNNPDTPSEEEIQTYETLKIQLSLLVPTLPPYMVSKLNGDQLGALNISTKLPGELPDYRGTMDEDEVSIKLKNSTMNAAAAASRTPAPTATRTSYPQNVPAPTTHRPNYLPQVPNTRGPQQPYYPNTPGRPPYPAASFPQRPPSSTAPRPPYPFGNQTPRPTPYGQSQMTPQQYFSQPNQRHYSYNQPVSQTPAAPQAPMQTGQFPQHGQPPFQARAQSSTYGPSQSPYAARSASPQKPPSFQRQQTPLSYFQGSQSPQQSNPLMNNSLGGYRTHLGAEDQAAIIERNRAALAANFKNATQGDVSRPGSSTPQPPHSSPPAPPSQPNDTPNGTSTPAAVGAQ